MKLLDEKETNFDIKFLQYRKLGRKINIKNPSSKIALYILPKLFFSRDRIVSVDFKGTEIEGNGTKLALLDRKKQKLLVSPINSKVYNTSVFSRMFIVVLAIPPESEVNIDTLKINTDLSDKSRKIPSKKFFTGDTLLVTPIYPSIANKYSGGFVHTRARAYIQSGIKLDVALITETKGFTTYTYEGVKVFKGNYYDLRQLLQQKKYKRILIHFFGRECATVLDSCDLTGTKLYFYLHGAETLYWDWNKITNPYFGKKEILSVERVKDFRERDEVIKKYNEHPNAKWVFVSPWAKRRSEELLQIKYKNSICIPCWIDENLFKEEKKDSDLRKKIFVLRKFDNINTYSIDTVVRIILELSRRKFFKELEFNIYGEGSHFDFLLKPVEEFENVKLHKQFLTHEEIRKVHQSHGITLFPTRFDTQGVSACEAASSGCVVISSINPGVEQFILPEYGTLCDPENYKEYADLIEKFYYDEKLFQKTALRMPENVRKECSFKATIGKELKMFEEEAFVESKYQEWDRDPLLTVVVPSYNVQQYLRHTVYSLLNHRNRNKIEILIINDGSQDNTPQIGEELEKQYNKNGYNLVRLINKENGGHGSTINVGIKEAKGKYIKIVDGDDTVDSFEFAKLIDYLEEEDTDIILTDYIEDYASEGKRNLRRLYKFLSPGVQYHFEDLCYKGYGFRKWGPILSTSTYKTEMLRKAKFALSEKMYYVDMELNTHIALVTETVKYYPLPLYRYLLGNQGQSVSRQSFTRNYKHHENVIIKMLETLYSKSNISTNRVRYIKRKLILPMIKTQYTIVTKYVGEMDAFNSFDKRLRKYKEYYCDKRVAKWNIKLHRVTKAVFIRLEKI